jgi:hypothetical protein
MAGISSYLEKALLDWTCGGATPTQPTVRALGLSLGTPTTIAGSEIATGSGYTRQTISFNAAILNTGTVSNAIACTFGPFSAACTVISIEVWDTLAATVGNLLWFGTALTPRTLSGGDSYVVAAGALTIQLS